MQEPYSAPAPPSRREYLTAFLFTFAATAILFSPTWGKVLFFRDLLRWSFPGLSFFRQSLLAGELPLWNPYLFCGYPFLAEMANAVLYPMSLLLLPCSVPFAMKLYPAAHYFLTGCLMWRLLRAWKLEPTAALFGALCWMASGYLVSMHLNFNYLAPAAWYPGLLFAGHRLLQTRRLGWLFATALAWAMIFLAGDPQAALWAGVLLLLYAGCFHNFAGARRAVPLQSYSLLVMVGVLTLLLVLAQVLPSLEFGAWSSKLKGYNFDDAAQWSFHPLRLLEWIWPGLWGPIFPAARYWGQFLHSYSATPWAGSVYLGLLPLLLALRETRRFREPVIGFLVLTGTVFFLLALGYYSPLYRLVWAALPPYRIFRYPEKHLALVAFAIAGLAGFGLQGLLGPEAAGRRRGWVWFWSGASAFLLTVWLGLWLVGGPLAPDLAAYLQRACQFDIEPSWIRADLLRASGRALAVALAFSAVWLFEPRSAWVRRRFGYLLLSLAAADLLSFGQNQFAVTHPYLYQFTPRAKRLLEQAQNGSQEPVRCYRASFSCPVHLVEPVGLSRDEQQVFWTRDTLINNLSMAEGLADVFGYDPSNPNRIYRFQARPLKLETLQMLNVKFLLDGIELGEVPPLPELRVAAEDPERNLRIWLNRDYFPRAFFVDGVRPARNQEEAFAFLFATDLRRQVVLEGSAAAARPGAPYLPGRLVEYRNRKVVVEITNPVAGHLVLSDAYFPGWEAAVDGKPARIYSANYLVRAVALEPGPHRIEFTYRPWPWRVGAIASLVSLLWLALLLCRRSGLFPGAKAGPGPRSPG